MKSIQFSNALSLILEYSLYSVHSYLALSAFSKGIVKCSVRTICTATTITVMTILSFTLIGSDTLL